jgi:4-hydroxyphenylpyruvate dioxygenase
MTHPPFLPLEIMASTLRYLPAISSMSLGRAWNHDIAPKLAACARHGYKGIELFYEDLEYTARSLPPSYPASARHTSFPNSTEWEEQQLAAASYIRQLCDINRLDIICLQPFMHYEGLLDRSEHEKRITKLKLWFLLAKRLRTDLIQIPSNFLPTSECTGDLDVIVSDLQKAADLGLAQSPPIRFAYEALCWGTHVDTWNASYEIAVAVNRPNFGSCIDTFNLAGRVYGDPASPTGKTPYAEADMAASLAKLRKIDVKKIFYVEVVDAERLSTPLVEGHPWYSPEQKARMSWSRNARLFAFEKESYLPILDILKVVTEELGYQGYISFELFSRSMNEKGDKVPEEHAVRGARSWKTLVKEMGWETEEAQQPRHEEPETDVRKGSARLSTRQSDASPQVQLAAPKL